jgi:imidazolonepropionase-like amidohydrolase
MRLNVASTLTAVSMLVSFCPALADEHLIRGVNVVDIQTGMVAEDQDILVRDGLIAVIGNTPLDAPGADVLEGNGGFVIPGLWDSHVHVFASPAEPAVAFPLYILNGVTGVRDMGGLLPLDEIKRIAAAVETGEVIGPRIVLSGAWVDASPGSWPRMFLADTPEQARAVVQRIDDEGWAAVKSYSMLREDVYLALAAEAEAVELPLVGHIPESVALPTAIGAGHDAVEHFGRITKACSTEEAAMIERVTKSLAAEDPRSAMIEEMTGHNRIVLDTWEQALCARLLDSMVAADVHVIPTLIVSDFYTGKRPADLEERMAMLPTAVQEGWSQPDFRLEAMTDELRAIAEDSIALDWRTFRMAHEAGMAILAGSDASFANPFIFHGYSLLDELDRYVAAGLTPREALLTATIAPAEFLGLAEETGSVLEGMRADLVILDGNPLDDLQTLRKPRAVVVNGHLIDAEALEEMRAQLIGDN